MVCKVRNVSISLVLDCFCYVICTMWQVPRGMQSAKFVYSVGFRCISEHALGCFDLSEMGVVDFTHVLSMFLSFLKGGNVLCTMC